MEFSFTDGRNVRYSPDLIALFGKRSVRGKTQK